VKVNGNILDENAVQDELISSLDNPRLAIPPDGQLASRGLKVLRLARYFAA
jgi:hypothetical protein